MQRSVLSARLGLLALLGACAVTACGNDSKPKSNGTAGAAASGNASGGSLAHAGSEAGGAGDSVAGQGGAHAGSGGVSGGGRAGSGGKGGSAGKGGGSGEGGAESAGAANAGDGSGGESGASSAEPVCGNGIKEAGEQCEPNSTTTCNELCELISTPECVACEEAGACASSYDACSGFSQDAVSICYSVQKCVRDSNCADGASAPQSCFCGALSAADCSSAPETGAGSPAGACAGVIREAVSEGANVATNTQVLARLIDAAYPGGAAMNRINCDKSDDTCRPICGFGN